MKRFSHLPWVFGIILVGAAVGHGQDYQKIADAMPWKFSTEQASVTDSFLRFSMAYQVELIRPSNKPGPIIIRVVAGGKELVAWTGHYRSVFTSSGDVLVYADFGHGRTGCTLIACDLKTGKQLWKTPLQGLGPIPHSRYSNSVNLEIINSDAVRVFGDESAGQYLEIVDLKSGKTVGHRRYKK